MGKTVTLRNIPDNVIGRLRSQARRNGRSMQAELLSIVTATVVDRESLREQIAACRQAMRTPLTPEKIRRAIEEGQP
jgi:plasmid stability protein